MTWKLFLFSGGAFSNEKTGEASVIACWILMVSARDNLRKRQIQDLSNGAGWKLRPARPQAIFQKLHKQRSYGGLNYL